MSVVKFVLFHLVLALGHLTIIGVEAFLIREHSLNEFKVLWNGKLVKLGLLGHVISFISHLAFIMNYKGVFESIEMQVVNQYRFLISSITDGLTIMGCFLVFGINDNLNMEFLLLYMYAFTWFKYYYILHFHVQENTIDAGCVQWTNTPLVILLLVLMTSLVMFITSLVHGFRLNADFDKDPRFSLLILAMIIVFLHLIEYLLELTYLNKIKKLQRKTDRITESDEEESEEVEGEKTINQKDVKTLDLQHEIKAVSLKIDYMHFTTTFINQTLISIGATAIFVKLVS